MRVFRVLAQNRVQQRVLWSRPLTFQLLMVVVDGAVMEVSHKQGSTAFSGADHVDIPVPHGRLRPLLRTLVLVPWMSRFKGCFALFPR